MKLEPHVQSLQSALASLAEVGDEHSVRAAERLAGSLEAPLLLVLLDVLGEASSDISAQLPDGHVDVRMAGRDADLVYVGSQTAEPEPEVGDDALDARITLRLPTGLKAEVEAAAARAGLSTNAWLVRALSRSVTAPAPGTTRTSRRLSGYARS
jgi:hypothetical protein